MLPRSESMLAVITKAVCILVSVSLVSQSSAKPALEHWFEKIDSDETPPYIQCRTTFDCHNKDRCCNIGRQRFSIPRCSPYGAEGDLCFPGAVAMNKNLSYPDGVTVHYKGVYDIICPCAMGLTCDHETNKCVRDDNINEGRNHLYNSFRKPFEDDYDNQYDLMV